MSRKSNRKFMHNDETSRPCRPPMLTPSRNDYRCENQESKGHRTVVCTPPSSMRLLISRQLHRELPSFTILRQLDRPEEPESSDVSQGPVLRFHRFRFFPGGMGSGIANLSLPEPCLSPLHLLITDLSAYNSHVHGDVLDFIRIDPPGIFAQDH